MRIIWLGLCLSLGAGCAGQVAQKLNVGADGAERVAEHTYRAVDGPPLALRIGSMESEVMYDGLSDLGTLLGEELTRSGRFTLDDQPQAVVHGVVQQFDIQPHEQGNGGWRVRVRAELRLLDGDQNALQIVGGVVNGVDSAEGLGRGEAAARALRLALGRAIDRLNSSLGG